MNITVAGGGFVGMAISVLLATKHHVRIYEPVQKKVEMINNGISPVDEAAIRQLLEKVRENINALSQKEAAYNDADLVVVAVPTDYCMATNSFDTSAVEDVIKSTKTFSPNATILIKSTVPIGFTAKASAQYGFPHLIFSPEFLREGSSVYDLTHPSRIILGLPSQSRELEQRAKIVLELFCDISVKKKALVMRASASEAEAIKLFSNTYLAMRVAFFNEVDTFAAANSIDAENIIKGITSDPRIGCNYCNPSFGYGGYCLPKDSKQLLAQFAGVLQNIIAAVVEANVTRKKFIIEKIIECGAKSIGIYRLQMKAGSSNYRMSSMIDIIEGLLEAQKTVVIYEPLLSSSSFMGCKIARDLSELNEMCDLIVANRKTEELLPYKEKVFSRDIFHES